MAGILLFPPNKIKKNIFSDLLNTCLNTEAKKVISFLNGSQPALHSLNHVPKFQLYLKHMVGLTCPWSLLSPVRNTMRKYENAFISVSLWLQVNYLTPFSQQQWPHCSMLSMLCTERVAVCLQSKNSISAESYRHSLSQHKKMVWNQQPKLIYLHSTHLRGQPVSAFHCIFYTHHM